MLTPEEIKKWILKNCVNKVGHIDLSDIDLSDFNGNVFIRHWKVKKDLDISEHEVGRHLGQCFQVVGGNLNQSFQLVGGSLSQVGQKVKGEIHNSIWERENKKVDEKPIDEKSIDEKPIEKDEPVSIDYEAEYKRTQQELCKANETIETLMFALKQCKENNEE